MPKIVPGTLIDDRYQVLQFIGEGGMAAVYEAENVRLGNRFAIKVMHGAMQRSRTGAERFVREAKALAGLEHPNIVRVFDIVLFEDAPVIVMELMQGETLADRIDAGRRPTGAEIEQLAREMLDALGYAHSRGIVHRDVKPDNIFCQVLHDGRIVDRLMDFGIAKSAAEHGLTSTGQFVGTRRYASPEQIRTPRDVDHRSDLYSLGVTLWECATGTVPWSDANSEFDVMQAITSHPGYSLYGLPHDPRLDALIRGLTLNAREERYQSAADALAAFVGARPPLPSGTGTGPRPLQAAAAAASSPVAPRSGPQVIVAAPLDHGVVAQLPVGAAYSAPPAQWPVGGASRTSGFLTGRIGRLRYFGELFVQMLGFLFGGFAVAVGEDTGSLVAIGMGSIAILAALPFYVRTNVRRFHDMGQTGWLVLLMFLPYVGILASTLLLFAPGQPEANRFGAPPGQPVLPPTS